MMPQMMLSLVLMIATLANARSLRFLAAADVPTDAYELVCTQSTTAATCFHEFGTHCNSTGVMLGKGSFTDECSEAFCFCRLLSTPVTCTTNPADPPGYDLCGPAATSNSPAPPGALTTMSGSQLSAAEAIQSSFDASADSWEAAWQSSVMSQFVSIDRRPTGSPATATLQTSFSVASAASRSNFYNGLASASAAKTVYITVTQGPIVTVTAQPSLHQNGTASQNFTETGSHRHHNGTSTHSHDSLASDIVSGQSTSASLPSAFTTLTENPLTPSGAGFASNEPSIAFSASGSNLASTTKTMSALTTGGYD